MSFIPGANVGPYRIVEQAERNGVATTYTAYQPSLGRYVSVVVVPSIDPDDLPSMRQYQRQVELAVGLRHTNILSVLDHGEHLGVPFVVTELVDAEPLAERIGAPWPLAEVTRVLRPIAAALDYAHQQGAVHGDVRPSMVLLTPDGTPILSGFGQVTRRVAAPSGIATGELGRRTASVAEDAAQTQQADRRGLALIAYEMLTGRSVDADTTDLDRPLPPARLGSPLLTPAVEQVLRRELSGDAADRYPSASAFVADLTAPVEPARPVAAPVPPPEPASAPPPSSGDARRRLITIALIVAAVMVLGSLLFLLRGTEATRPIASPARPTVTDAASPGSASGAAVVGSPGSGTTAGTSAGTTAGASAGAVNASAASATSGAGQPSSAEATSGTAGAESKPAEAVVVPTPDVSAIASASTVQPGTSSTGQAATGATPQAGGSTTTGNTGPGAAQPGATPGAAGPSVSSGAGTPSASAVAAAQPPTAAPVPAQTPRPAPPAAAGSTRLPVTWRTVGDPSGRWALDDEGRVAGRTETGASMLLFPETVDDVGFSALVSTTSCQATLVFRAQDDENLLMAIYIPDGLPNPGTAGGGVWLYQRVEGLDLPIRAVRPSTVRPAGEPVRLKIITSGPQIAIFLNDEPALQAVDTAPRSGKLGLMVYSTSGRLCEATFGDIQR
jgi:serine/threonine-protein kinase